MKKTVFYVLLLSYAPSFAQGIQMNQMPLLYHPSFAGSTGGGRLAFSTQGFYEKYNQGLLSGGLLSNYNYTSPILKSALLTNYLSFDHLWKGIGWGVVLKNKDLLYSWDFGNGQTYKGSAFANGADIVVSPKFILKNRNGVARLTLAPSLSLGYSQENPRTNSYHFGVLDGAPYESNIDKYYSKTFETHGYGRWGAGFEGSIGLHSLYQASFGLMLNSPKAYLGLTYQHNTAIRKVLEKVSYYSTYTTDSTEYINLEKSEDLGTKVLTTSYSVLSLVSGKTFKQAETSKFSLSYQLYIAFGMAHNKNQIYGSPYFMQNFSANFTATYGKVYLGAGGAVQPIPNVALFTGYQSKRMRIGVSYGWRASGDIKPRSTVGLSASFFFPK